MNPKVIENLYATDLAYLQNLYNAINQLSNGHLSVTCPECQRVFEVEQPVLGG
jgi:hypothetical protein